MDKRSLVADPKGVEIYDFCKKHYSQRTLDKIIRLNDTRRVSRALKGGPSLPESDIMELFERLRGEMLEELSFYCFNTYKITFLQMVTGSRLKNIERGFNKDTNHDVRLTFDHLHYVLEGSHV